MKKIIFILGGARSGKSKFALNLAKNLSKNVVFLATGEAKDEEMKKRIKQHQEQRPKSWKTIEEPINLKKAIKKNTPEVKLIIIDCLSLWVSNLLLKFKEEEILENVKELLKFLKEIPQTVILISNEVGLGIVPKNKLARTYRDILGITNQLVSEKADEVYFLISGMAKKIK